MADRQHTDIASIASRFILDQPGVAGVIVGARNGNHLAANVAVNKLRLSQLDHNEIAVVLSQRQGPGGEVYELERDRGGRHGAVMKYNLGTSGS